MQEPVLRRRLAEGRIRKLVARTFIAGATMDSSPEVNRKSWERLVFATLAIALFPVLAVIVVASYGFAVWVWQMFSGPPGG